jgi:cytochrome b subunit of formate dehydrogenase/mono/diheme cytochrome c family protein
MSDERKVLRFPLTYRIEHLILLLSFTTLAVTGLVQKFDLTGVSDAIIRTLGGIETTRLIHHTAAIVLMVLAVYHIGAVGYRVFVRRTRLNMLPTLEDVRQAIQTLRYNFGLTKLRPQQGRYTFEEKLEYWALIWGTVIMALTGFMMWNPIATTHLLPGEYIPAAKAAHGAEAVLAVLAIIIWHWYQVHLRHFNKSMFTGTMGEDEMMRDHPLELADLKAGVAERQLDPRELRRRKRIFYPAYGLLAGALLFGIYAFATFEQTAITTLPAAENVAIFAPLTPTPFPTPIPIATSAAPFQASSWNGGIGQLFEQKCSACHAGSSPTAGLDLTSYAGALKGAQAGPVILPGNPDGSLLVSIQSAGNHPGQLSGDELAAVRQWILDGAPEK